MPTFASSSQYGGSVLAGRSRKGLRRLVQQQQFVPSARLSNRSPKADFVSGEAEREAFAQAWAYLRARPNATVFIYSKYERTVWRKLREKYPDVCTADEIEALFDPIRTVDLYYDVIQPATLWPTRDHSLKTLAKFLGFQWRDTNPSGAASIEWFDQWLKTGETAIRQRIIDYNQDDVIATRVLLDGIRGLSLSSD